MALNFQGDRAVGVLNDPKNTFNTDDLFRVYDGGILVAGGVSVDHGDFVSWDGTKWKLETDIKIARSDEISNTNSSIAPNYTKKTYEANSYVMQGGVLYTNENAIETAEDWNPAHWTQTTVAEMITNIPQPQTGYTSVTRSAVMDTANSYKLDVGQKEVITCNVETVSAMASTTTLRLEIPSDVNDAIIVLTKSGSYRTRLNYLSSSTTRKFIYNNAFKHYETEMLDADEAGSILLTTKMEEPSCGSPYPVAPDYISEIETLYDRSEGTGVVTDISLQPFSLRSDDRWIIRVAGDYIFVDAA